MLGHTDGVVAAGWPEFDEAVAKADEIVVPVQVNGKAAHALDRSCGFLRRCAQRAGARGSAGGEASGGEDGAEGRRRRRPGFAAGQRRGELMMTRHGCRSSRPQRSPCVLLVRSPRSHAAAATRSRAAARFCRPHQDHRRADVRQQHAGVRDRAEDHGEGPCSNSSGADGTKCGRIATGVDAVLLGDILGIAIAPAAFNDQQQATRYAVTLVAKIEFRDLKTDKVLWQNPQMVFSEQYDVTTTQTAHRSERVPRPERERHGAPDLRVRADDRQRDPGVVLIPSRLNRTRHDSSRWSRWHDEHDATGSLATSSWAS